MPNQEIRIQKVLSDNGVLSRRKAEEAIAAGRVTVNGRPCPIGQKIDPRKDIIAIDGVRVPIRTRQQKVYLILNKPRGYVTTTNDELGRQCVTELVKNAPARVYPVGRLDRNSEGLLLFTNDGALANEIMHPRGHVSKTYRVTVRPSITEQQLIDLATGVTLDDGHKTAPAAVHVLTQEPGRVVVQFTVYEGHNRLIRRMCEAVGLELVRLKRTAIGPVKLGMLKPGEWRELKPSELIALRGSVQKAAARAEQEDVQKKAADRNKTTPRRK